MRGYSMAYHLHSEPLQASGSAMPVACWLLERLRPNALTRTSEGLRKMRRIFAPATAAAIFAAVAPLASSPPAHAQQAPAPAAAPAAPAAWTDTLKFSGYLEAGITGNFDAPSDGINFGHLFTDRANSPLLNQFSLIAERRRARDLGAGSSGRCRWKHHLHQVRDL